MKTVVMLATTHQHQMATNAPTSELWKCLDYLRSKFKVRRSVDVQIVMEEWHENLGETVVKEFATRSGLRWANVGTPNEAQFRTYTGPICFPGHDGTLQPDGDAPAMYEYGPFENQEARENRMAKNIQTEMEDYEGGLLVVGLAHMHSLFRKLQSAGFGVAAFSWL